MSKIQAWFVPVEGEPQSVTFDLKDSVLSEVSRKHFGGATLGLTKVRYRGRLCHMAVDDEGMCKGLPHNPIATQAYHANCIPGTIHGIHGDAVIFAGPLR
jgi:hypothetical protein